MRYPLSISLCVSISMSIPLQTHIAKEKISSHVPVGNTSAYMVHFPFSSQQLFHCVYISSNTWCKIPTSWGI